MTSHQLSATLKDSARKKLTGKYGNAALLTVSYSLITLIISWILVMILSFISTFISMFTGNTQIGVGYVIAEEILLIIANIFMGVMNTGISLFFLKLACGQPASVNDLFYGYQYPFRKSLILSAVNVIVTTVPLLPYYICNYMFQQNRTIEWGLAMLATHIIGLAICLPLSLALAQTFFLLLDFPGHSAKELISQSMRLMKGHKWQLFHIQLSFLPLLLLSFLSLGIGNLWVTPYLYMTMALFFLDIMKPAASSSN